MPTQETHTADQSGRSARALVVAAPWALSFLVHAGVLGGAAALMAAGGTRLVGPEPLEGTPVAFGEAQAPTPEERNRRTEEASTPSPVEQDPPPNPFSDLAPADESAWSAPSLEPLSVTSISPEALLPTMPSEDPSAASLEPVEGAVVAPGFFTARGDEAARRIVYVVDASGSMVSALPIVVRELRRSIEQLGPGQWFDVIFFKGGGYETPTGLTDVPEGALIRATPANRRAVFRWLQSVGPGFQSDPTPAIEHALSQRPDIVFLLSKGLLDAGMPASTLDSARSTLLSSLDALNPVVGDDGRRRTTIKVIQFFDADPGGVLQAIGRTHGGEGGFSFISRKELGLE